ncbi:hypothetical protein ACFFNY_01800 [Paenibacillus hodogayensis]|uniref:Right-handed parallel beta-helix repeat-containing protein n=1 Tax=Paenibacillus hodogayensis TaxID=279208 RepID=A0ABV5VPY3_9BACL
MESKKLSRRTLLSTMGIAGGAMLAGRMMPLGRAEAAGSASMLYIGTVAQMVLLASVEEGQWVRTNGYYIEGDGGGAKYRITASTSYAGTPDGYVDHALSAAGKVAVMDLSNGIDMKQIGVQSGVDGTARVRAAYAKNAKMYTYTGDMAPIIDCDDPNYPASKFSGGIFPPSFSYHRFDGQFRFQAKGSANGEYVLFNFYGREHVTMVRPWVVGDVGTTHTGTTGEWGFGFYLVSGAKHITIQDGLAEKFWGDGYYVGIHPSYPNEAISEHITLENCIADSNRRQGLSITAVRCCRVIGGEYRNTGNIAWTGPAFGIDIEPNAQAKAYVDVSLIDVTTRNNKMGGLELVPGFLSRSIVEEPYFNVFVSNYRSIDDGQTGAIKFNNPAPANAAELQKAIRGQIVIEKATVVRPKRKGVEWGRWGKHAPHVVASDILVQDPNEDGVAGISYTQQSAFVLTLTADDVTKGMTQTGRITLIRPRALDTRATPKMRAPFWMQTAAGSSVQRMTIVDGFGENDLDGNKGFVRVNEASGVTVRYTGDRPVKLLDSPLVCATGIWAGYELRLPETATGVLDVELPASTVSLGLTYTIVNASQAGGQVRIKASGADQLKANGTAAATQWIVEPQEAYSAGAHMAGVWSLSDTI